MSLNTTPSQTVGPFFSFGLTTEKCSVRNIASPQAKGKRVVLTCRILDGDGVGLPDAMVEIWQADAQGSYVWAFLGLHTFDFIADAIFTLVLLILIVSGRYAEKQRLGVHVDTVVWYFLVAIWIPIYILIYWGPRIFESMQ